MSELPKGWSKTSLGDVLELRYGKNLPAKERVPGEFLVYGSNGVIGSHAMAITASPTIVIGRKGSIGEVHFSDAPCFPIDTTYFVDGFDVLEPLFAKHLLQALPIRAMNRASAIPGLNREDAYKLSVSLPPLPEQRRIVAKIDSLSGKSRRARDHLDHIPRLVEKYKQAVLAAAFRADLTRDWRSENADRLGGSSCQSSFALDDSERGVWPSEQLPDEWEWRRFSSAFVDLTDSTRKLPQKEYLSEGRFPVVDQGADTIGGYTDRADLVHLSAPPFIIFGDHTRCVKFIEQPFVQGADGVKVLHTADDVLPSYGRLAL